MTQQPSATLSLTAVRRFYFYTVALISLIAGIIALDGLLGVLSDIWLGDRVGAVALYTANVGDYRRNAVARNGGLLLVAAPVFIFHWGYIQRRLTSEDERRASLRKLFLYGAAAASIIVAATRGYELLAGASFLALGGTPARSAILPSEWLHLLSMSAIGLLLNGYFQHILQADGDYGCETTRAGTVRRLFQTIVGLAGLMLVILGSAQMLETGWSALVVGRGDAVAQFDWWQTQLGDALAAAAHRRPAAAPQLAALADHHCRESG